MRRYLFLDNYRGFSQANIPIADVNFLVGENSTGKTSVLGLLRLLSSPGFFLGENFVSEDVQLGHFNELVSAHSADRTYFRIGTTQERSAGRGENLVSGMLFTYREETGLPRMEQITCAIEDREVHLRFEANGAILFRSVDTPKVSTVTEMNERIPGWIVAHCDEGGGWSQLELPEEMRGGNIPLAIVLSWASRKDEDKGPFGFFMPPLGPPLVWIDPIRTKSRRTYDEPRTSFSPDGSHTPYVIRRMLNSKTDATRFAEFFSRVGKPAGYSRESTSRSSATTRTPLRVLRLTFFWMAKRSTFPGWVMVSRSPSRFWWNYWIAHRIAGLRSSSLRYIFTREHRHLWVTYFLRWRFGTTSIS